MAALLGMLCTLGALSLRSASMRAVILVITLVTATQATAAACSNHDRRMIAVLNQFRSYAAQNLSADRTLPKLFAQDGEEIPKPSMSEYISNTAKLGTIKPAKCNQIIKRELLAGGVNRKTVSIVFMFERFVNDLCAEDVQSEKIDAKICSGRPGYEKIVQRWNFYLEEPTGAISAVRFVAEVR